MIPAPASSAAAPDVPKAGLGARLKQGWHNAAVQLQSRARLCKNFVKELFADHGFWVEALAVKGGASTIVIAGIVAASYVVALPFFAAAAGIVACTGMVALGIYGISAGSMKAWENLKDIYARATGKAPKEHHYVERKDLLQRFAESKLAGKIRHHPLTRKVVHSRAWQITEKFSKKREDSILGGIAVGGAALTLTLGGIALASQLLVLPVIAAGTLLTFATVTAASSVASGLSGLYFSITGIRDRAAQRKELMAAQAELAAQQAVAPKVDIAPVAAPVIAIDLAASFDQAVAMPAAAPVNDNSGDNRNKPVEAPKTAKIAAPK